jgi:DNA polymerase elongation subunit (family B)
MVRPTIAFDMETVGFEWERLDEPTRKYLLERAARKSAREGLPEGGIDDLAHNTLSLAPGTAKIVVIALWNIESGHGALLYEGDTGWVDTGDGSTRIFRGNEARMLQEFWQLLDRYGRVVTYNGRNFDLPFAYIRSALHGIRPSRNLLGNRFSIADHCDLSEVLTFFGAAQERFSLDYWCRRFGIESPKGEGIDGSQVGDFYRAGRLHEIAKYCLRDAEATGLLYRKLEHTLVDLWLRR